MRVKDQMKNETEELNSEIRNPKSEILRVLLIEDNPGDARLIREMLADVDNVSVELEHADRLGTGFERLAAGGIDGLLLDLSLPDSHGLETFSKTHAQAPEVATIVLTGFDDEELAIRAVREGAQDYLVKGQVDGPLLLRSLQYAIERKRAEHQLKQAHADLQKSHEELKATQLQLIHAEKLESVGRLAAGIAHEVKNPLEIILMSAEYLSKNLTNCDEQTAMTLDDIQYAVRRADSVVRGLLDFSASDELHTHIEGLNPIIEESCLLVKHELDRNHIGLVKELGEDLPPVSLDRNKIQQVFVNLFMNAAHAMPDGGTLTVKTYAKQLADTDYDLAYNRTNHFKIGETVLITEVKDTGTGIPEDKLAKVFDPFFTTKPTGKGTGLGLTVTNKILELHGGVIDIKNREEGGVRICVVFKAQRKE